MARRLTRLLPAALVLALAACGGGDGDAGTADRTPRSSAAPITAPPIDPTRRSQEIVSRDVLGTVDVVTAIEQPRYLEGTPRITVPVRFEGEGRFRVRGIAVRTPLFDELPVEVVSVAMVPGQRVALQVDLGAPVCDPPAPAQPLVHLEISVDEGPPTPLELPVPDWLIDELHEVRCAEAAVAEQVAVRLAPDGGRDGVVVSTDLLLERQGGDEPVSLTELTGSVILWLQPEDDGEPIAVLAGRDERVRLPVRATAARCDPHAVTGSTKTFVFHAWIQVGDEPPVRIDLRPPKELEAVMQEAIAACLTAR